MNQILEMLKTRFSNLFIIMKSKYIFCLHVDKNDVKTALECADLCIHTLCITFRLFLVTSSYKFILTFNNNGFQENMESGPLFVERMFYLKNMKEQGIIIVKKLININVKLNDIIV